MVRKSSATLLRPAKPAWYRENVEAHDLLTHAAHLSDRALLARVDELAQQEREATAGLVAHLAELEARGLHLAAGYPSLFDYCIRGLHLAEHAAYHRIQAARAVRRFPVLLDHLAAIRLHLAAIRLLAPHLTPENLDAVLAEARGKSKREVEVLVARLHPQPRSAGPASHAEACGDRPAGASPAAPGASRPGAHRLGAGPLPAAPQRAAHPRGGAPGGLGPGRRPVCVRRR